MSTAKLKKLTAILQRYPRGTYIYLRAGISCIYVHSTPLVLCPGDIYMLLVLNNATCKLDAGCLHRTFPLRLYTKAQDSQTPAW
jgi:hypothetical protein